MLLDPSTLPIDLEALLQFVVHDSFVQQLVNSSSNHFFAPVTAPSGTRIGVREKDGSWDLLPVEWRAYFDGVDVGARREVLKDLADGTSRGEFPTALRAFLDSCRSLSLDRTCSSTPILSHPPQPSPLPPIPTTIPSYLSDIHGALLTPGKAHMSPKKLHECVQFSSLVSDLLDSPSAPTHVVDVGSGRAHLSRTLASSPLSLQVLALDWSPTLTFSAERLDLVKPEPIGGGCLTHRTSNLDAEGITRVMQEWPGEAPAILVALHACGDLTIDALKAFLASPTHHQLVAVGCCYNIQTPSLFPLSTLFPSSASITRLHLMLSPHSPPTWHLSPHSITALSSSLAKLIYRARFNAEVEASTPPSDTDASAWKLRVGRIPDCVSYEDYRARATVKFGEVEEVEFEGGEKGWEDAKWGMQLFWTMRSWVGPVVESLVVLDRWAFVVQGLEEGRRVELVNLFEQGTGSLRNLAIVVRCVGGGR